MFTCVDPKRTGPYLLHVSLWHKLNTGAPKPTLNSYLWHKNNTEAGRFVVIKKKCIYKKSV